MAVIVEVWLGNKDRSVAVIVTVGSANTVSVASLVVNDPGQGAVFTTARYLKLFISTGAERVTPVRVNVAVVAPE